MRQIKFRAWDNELKRHFPVDCINYHSNGLTLCAGNKEGTWGTPDSDFILEQFTGLTDKNGTNIYEGDLVKMVNPSQTEPTGYEIEGALGVVVWKDWGRDFSFRCAQWDIDVRAVYNWQYCFGRSESLEVIGNVHQKQ